MGLCAIARLQKSGIESMRSDVAVAGVEVSQKMGFEQQSAKRIKEKVIFDPEGMKFGRFEPSIDRVATAGPPADYTRPNTNRICMENDHH
ncbi:hypothetical protein RB195_010937 [Necator americanus]|uniref:Uncharacterized protein n=1 Tax=Necator americanus TaxID=51031 RepID=A0ABR1D1E9_NECAM